MRMGPGKHLKGRKLFNGIVAPEEVSLSWSFHFHVLIGFLSLITSTS